MSRNVVGGEQPRLHMPAELSFEQRARAGRKKLVVTGEQVVIRAFGVLHAQTYSFRLADLQPRVERVRGRYPRLVLFHVGAASFLASLLRFALQREFVPLGVALALGVPAIATFIVLAVNAWSQMESIRFFDKQGKLCFDVVKEKYQDAECEVFVADITARIRAAR